MLDFIIDGIVLFKQMSLKRVFTTGRKCAIWQQALFFLTLVFVPIVGLQSGHVLGGEITKAALVVNKQVF